MTRTRTHPGIWRHDSDTSMTSDEIEDDDVDFDDGVSSSDGDATLCKVSRGSDEALLLSAYPSSNPAAAAPVLTAHPSVSCATVHICEHSDSEDSDNESPSSKESSGEEENKDEEVILQHKPQNRNECDINDQKSYKIKESVICQEHIDNNRNQDGTEESASESDEESCSVHSNERFSENFFESDEKQRDLENQTTETNEQFEDDFVSVTENTEVTLATTFSNYSVPCTSDLSSALTSDTDLQIERFAVIASEYLSTPRVSGVANVLLSEAKIRELRILSALNDKRESMQETCSSADAEFYCEQEEVLIVVGEITEINVKKVQPILNVILSLEDVELQLCTVAEAIEKCVAVVSDTNLHYCQESLKQYRISCVSLIVEESFSNDVYIEEILDQEFQEQQGLLTLSEDTLFTFPLACKSLIQEIVFSGLLYTSCCYENISLVSVDDYIQVDCDDVEPMIALVTDHITSECFVNILAHTRQLIAFDKQLIVAACTFAVEFEEFLETLLSNAVDDNQNLSLTFTEISKTFNFISTVGFKELRNNFGSYHTSCLHILNDLIETCLPIAQSPDLKAAVSSVCNEFLLLELSDINSLDILQLALFGYYSVTCYVDCLLTTPVYLDVSVLANKENSIEIISMPVQQLYCLPEACQVAEVDHSAFTHIPGHVLSTGLLNVVNMEYVDDVNIHQRHQTQVKPMTLTVELESTSDGISLINNHEEMLSLSKQKPFLFRQADTDAKILTLTSEQETVGFEHEELLDLKFYSIESGEHTLKISNETNVIEKLQNPCQLRLCLTLQQEVKLFNDIAELSENLCDLLNCAHVTTCSKLIGQTFKISEHPVQQMKVCYSAELCDVQQNCTGLEYMLQYINMLSTCIPTATVLLDNFVAITKATVIETSFYHQQTIVKQMLTELDVVTESLNKMMTEFLQCDNSEQLTERLPSSGLPYQDPTSTISMTTNIETELYDNEESVSATHDLKLASSEQPFMKSMDEETIAKQLVTNSKAVKPSELSKQVANSAEDDLESSFTDDFVAQTMQRVSEALAAQAQQPLSVANETVDGTNNGKEDRITVTASSSTATTPLLVRRNSSRGSFIRNISARISRRKDKKIVTDVADSNKQPSTSSAVVASSPENNLKGSVSHEQLGEHSPKVKRGFFNKLAKSASQTFHHKSSQNVQSPPPPAVNSTIENNLAEQVVQGEEKVKSESAKPTVHKKSLIFGRKVSKQSLDSLPTEMVKSTQSTSTAGKETSKTSQVQPPSSQLVKSSSETNSLKQLQQSNVDVSVRNTPIEHRGAHPLVRQQSIQTSEQSSVASLMLDSGCSASPARTASGDTASLASALRLRVQMSVDSNDDGFLSEATSQSHDPVVVSVPSSKHNETPRRQRKALENLSSASRKSSIRSTQSDASSMAPNNQLQSTERVSGTSTSTSTPVTASFSKPPLPPEKAGSKKSTKEPKSKKDNHQDKECSIM
jgi:hypothetical protein